MKLVALDVGEKRIGVATADSKVRIAVPHSTVEADGGELAKIAKIMQDEGAKHLIVGLPRNAQGEETIQSQKVRTFAKSLQDYFAQHKLERPLVKFQDESLTSVIAETHLVMGRRKGRHKQHQKGDIDREAAALILQDFLDGFGGDAQSEQAPDADTKKKRKGKSKLIKVFVTIVGLLLTVIAGSLIWYMAMTRPVISEANCTGTNSPHEKCVNLEFVVTEGESTNAIVDRLESEGLIRSALTFKIYMRLNHEGAVLRVGTYSLNSSMSITDIVNKLKGGSVAETFRITFLPGGTVADAKKRLADAGFAVDKIEAGFVAQYNHPVFEGKPDNGTLEGYIFGETYEFYTTATVEDVLKRTFDELYRVVQENDLVAKYTKEGLSLYEGITLASIIQREAPMDRHDDVRQVAQVFLLRLERNVPLGSCAINEYRADLLGIPRNSELHENLNILGCPWSSRHCTGLPPTPISSPGEVALLAVASPTEGDYLFFITDDDGNMRYARTATEHQRNIDNYCKVRCYYQ